MNSVLSFRNIGGLIILSCAYMLSSSRSFKIVCLGGCSVYLVDIITRFLYKHRLKIGIITFRHYIHDRIPNDDKIHVRNVDSLEYHNIKLDFDYD